MLSSLVYSTLLTLLRKDARGNSVSVEEYNRLASIVNTKLYQKYFESESSDDSLSAFRVMQSPINLVVGGNSAMPYAKGFAPSNFYWMSGKPFCNDNGTARFLDQVTPPEIAYRYADFLTQPTIENPLYQITTADGNPNSSYAFLCYPSTISTIYLDYYRIANTPVLDYYMNNTTFQKTYLDEGVTYVIPVGSTYSDGSTSGSKVSKTIDWEWAEADLPIIMAMMLQEAGITLPDQLLLEVGINNEKDLL